MGSQVVKSSQVLFFFNIEFIGYVERINVRQSSQTVTKKHGQKGQARLQPICVSVGDIPSDIEAQ